MIWYNMIHFNMILYDIMFDSFSALRCDVLSSFFCICSIFLNFPLFLCNLGYMLPLLFLSLLFFITFFCLIHLVYAINLYLSSYFCLCPSLTLSLSSISFISSLISSFFSHPSFHNSFSGIHMIAFGPNSKGEFLEAM